MNENDINYNFFQKELVDMAKDFAESYYKENHFESDIKCLELNQKLPEESQSDLKSLIYKQMLERLESAYLYGMQYAVSHKIDSIKPSHETQLYQYQKDKDFAFIFKFGDNDFGNYFEHAAEEYCKCYNHILGNICLYPENNYYIKKIETLEKQEIIIESLKNGIASYSFKNNIDTYQPEKISYEQTLKDTNRYVNEYFDFNDMAKIWEKDENGKYIVTKLVPKLTIGTRADVEEVLKSYGTPDDNNNIIQREFPYWCNGEVLIVYMKNGFLTYVIR